MSNTILKIIETDQTIDALNAALAAKRIAADAVVAIHERAGDAVKARDQYSRFLALWRDGDQERGWVADAAKKTQGR